jgi:hypothetical protein
MEVKDSEGKVLFNDGVALGWVIGEKPFQRPLGLFSLPGYQVYVVGPAQGYFDPLIEFGQVRIEVYHPDSQTPVASTLLDPRKPQDLLGFTFTFIREKRFSGFQVSRDPGNPLIWVSSGLFTLGIMLVFSFPYRQLWVLCRRDGEGKTEVTLRPGGGRSVGTAWEMESLAADLEKPLRRERS